MPLFKDCSPRITFVLLVCLVILPQGLGQQQSPKPPREAADDVVRVKTELVQTDVTVLDKRGHFVDGLKSDQFELRLDAKPQPLAFFERVATGSAEEEKQLRAARDGKAGDPAN